jgi:hypothetical protein
MTRDSDSFLVEATTSFSGIVDGDRRPTRETAILPAVDQATNPNFAVRLEIEQVGPDQPKVREITEPLEQWLSGLDPDDVLAESIFDAPQKPLEVRAGSSGSRRSLYLPRAGVGRTIGCWAWGRAWRATSMTASNSLEH